MNTYAIERVQNRADFEAKLTQLPKADIACFPWPHVNKLEPRSYAVVTYDDKALHVHMHTEEPTVRAQVTERNGPVHTDSCLEFFFMPACGKNTRYFNFEVNPMGVFLFSWGTDRHDRQPVHTETDEDFAVNSLKNLADWDGKSWEVTYSIPFTTIKTYVPEFDGQDLSLMRGNFYKCGDGLPAPHWACWNPIDTPKPDYHRPEFFAPIQPA